MSVRLSPRESEDAAKGIWNKIGVRPSSQESRNLHAQGDREDEPTSPAAQSTPFFVGTNHKELRALLNARNNLETWAAMLEKEHPAQEWHEAYQALHQNQDPKQSVLFTLLYYQNERWLKARQVPGLASKSAFASCREEYSTGVTRQQDALFDMPPGMFWPKLAICSANSDALDHNFALTVVQEICSSHDTSASLICCAPDDGLQRDRAIRGMEGFLEELYYRTDIICHAGQGCGGNSLLKTGGPSHFQTLASSERVSQKDINHAIPHRCIWCWLSTHGIRGAHSRLSTSTHSCANQLRLR